MRLPITIALLAACGDSKPTETKSDLDQLARSGPHTTVTMFDLSRDYAGNEVAADATYRGRALRIVGMVNRVGRDRDGTPIVYLGKDGRDLVACGWGKGDSSIASLKPGDGVGLGCVGLGKWGTLPAAGACVRLD